MASPTLLCLILLYLSCLFILPSSSAPIKLKLFRKIRHTHSNPYSQIPKRVYNYFRRHHHHKDPSSTSTPLYPTSDLYEYVIYLSVGTPPQNLPVVFDTGSSLVWVPCTSTYFCTNCTQTKANVIFEPNKSSSKQSVSCSNKKCSWLGTRSSMGSCLGPCAYNKGYGTGSTSGYAISDNLNLQGKIVVPDFFFGCSNYSDFVSQGIVGFGRNPMSLPNQLNLNKFSYCLVSHKFDDTSKSSPLILGDSGDVLGMKYTPLVKNPSMESYSEFYYIHLEQITIGEHVVELPQEILVPDSNGNGGTIIDSGSTFTSIDSTLFDPIVKEFMAQCKGAEIAPPSLGNMVCVNVTGLQRLDFPEIVFHLEGGVKMDLGVANYFDTGENVLCLPFMNTSIVPGSANYLGIPAAVILGNYQQFDFSIEFDLKNQRLGIMRKNCELV